jgi:general secretion pathway protein H
MRPTAPTGKSAGFTLLELLVVLLVMGIVVGLASVTARPDDRALLGVEADRLALLLDLAATEARNSGGAIAWTVQAPAYRFWRQGRDGQWIEIRDGDLLRARVLPEGMRFTGLWMENMRSREAMRLEFGPYGMASAFSIGMALGDAHTTVAGSPVGEIEVVPGAGG